MRAGHGSDRLCKKHFPTLYSTSTSSWALWHWQQILLIPPDVYGDKLGNLTAVGCRTAVSFEFGDKNVGDCAQ